MFILNIKKECHYKNFLTLFLLLFFRFIPLDGLGIWILLPDLLIESLELSIENLSFYYSFSS